MPTAPNYRKVNPADQPILILSLTSDVLSRGQLYDLSSTLLAQRLSQVDGVGQVNISGGALPAVRIELDPDRLLAQGLALEDVRQAVIANHSNRPKGLLDDGQRSWQIESNGQALKAADYAPVVVRYKEGRAVRLSDVAEVIDSTEDIRNEGQVNGKRSVLVLVYLQPNANIIETVDRVKELLPDLQAALPNDVDVTLASDRTTTIRASLKEVEQALVISVVLVVLVTFAFLRSIRAGFVPSVAVPVSLVGTFGVMYLLGYSLNNLSLMAMTVAAGFVVDDAIIMLENIQRHIEEGVPPFRAAIIGSREIAFAVMAMTVTLAALKLPLVLPPGEDLAGDVVIADIGIPYEVIDGLGEIGGEGGPIRGRGEADGALQPEGGDGHQKPVSQAVKRADVGYGVSIGDDDQRTKSHGEPQPRCFPPQAHG